MPNINKLARVSFVSGDTKLYADIGGSQLPLASVTLNYAVNQIPHASCTFPVGRNVTNTQEDNPIAAVMQATGRMTPASIVLEASRTTGEWRPSAGEDGPQIWPEGEHVLFVGYTAVTGRNRRFGSLGVQVPLVGQMVDLTMSSAGSAAVLPGAPADVFRRVFSDTDAAAATGDPVLRLAYSQGISVNFCQAVVNAMIGICKTDNIRTGSDAPASSVFLGEFSDNTRALNVLEESGLWKGMSGAFNGLAFPLQTADATVDIAAAMADRATQAYPGSTMWDLIVSATLPSFMCSVIPLSDRALIVPVLPNSKVPYKTLYSDEYIDEGLQIQGVRPLKGVVVESPVYSAASAAPKNRVGVDGAYPKDVGGITDGGIMFVKAPWWSQNLDQFDSGDGDIDPAIVVLAGQPVNAAGAVNGGVKIPPRADAAMRDDIQTTMDSYAKAMFQANNLLGRSGVVTTKLRFDIAPGSTILLKATPRNAEGQADDLLVDIYAQVTEVVCHIDAQTPSATTTLQLNNIRTAAENSLTMFSDTEHGLFGAQHYNGTRLVDTFKVDQDA